MYILKPLVYDPLLSWSRSTHISDDGKEKTDQMVMTNVKQIENRLKGFIRINGKKSNIPLSTEGQVNSIIEEAIIDNLACMFVGWSLFIKY